MILMYKIYTFAFRFIYIYIYMYVYCYNCLCVECHAKVHHDLAVFYDTRFKIKMKNSYLFLDCF